MTRNEKKIVLALARCFVHQLDVNIQLISLLPEAKAKDVQVFQDNIESQIQELIKLVQEEWNADEQR